MKFLKALFLLFLSLAFSSAATAGSLLDSIQKAGEIRVGVSIMPPWVMADKGGKLIGFEIDIARQLAKDIGVKAVFKQYQWKQMIPALQKGEIDIIASGLSITPQRALKINYSMPYASSGYSLVTNLSLHHCGQRHCIGQPGQQSFPQSQTRYP